MNSIQQDPSTDQVKERTPREPTPDPGDGRQWCPGCERWKFLAIHSCPRVPPGMSNLDFMRQVAGWSAP